MSICRTLFFAACLLAATAAHGDDESQPFPDLKDVVHKGLVGKALDAVPMDPGQRVVLQRTNAVVSGTLTGRTLAAWAGLSNPLLMVAGLLWGLYSAFNIQPEASARQDPGPAGPREPEPAQIAALGTPPVAVAADEPR